MTYIRPKLRHEVEMPELPGGRDMCVLLYVQFRNLLTAAYTAKSSLSYALYLRSACVNFLEQNESGFQCRWLCCCKTAPMATSEASTAIDKGAVVNRWVNYVALTKIDLVSSNGVLNAAFHSICSLSLVLQQIGEWCLGMYRSRCKP